MPCRQQPASRALASAGAILAVLAGLPVSAAGVTLSLGDRAIDFADPDTILCMAGEDRLDLLARGAGEEFVLVWPGDPDGAEAYLFLEDGARSYAAVNAADPDAVTGRARAGRGAFTIRFTPDLGGDPLAVEAEIACPPPEG